MRGQPSGGRRHRPRQKVHSFGSRQSRGHSAHIGAEVVVHYRWHPLHGRSLRRQYSERRGGGGGVPFRAAPGIVIVVPSWMLDPAACAGLGFGAPRVAVAALVDLHDLLNILGFRRGSTTDVVQETRHEAVPTPIDPRPAPRQLSLLPALTRLGQLSPDERRDAVGLLAVLLLEAAGPARPEVTNDRE